MKKFRTKLFSLLGITSIIGTTTIATSCGPSKPTRFNLSGGSLSLNAISGSAGKDTAAWKLYTSGGKEITSGITWKLTSATSAQLPTSISIANGLVSWTNQITAGTYEFYVCANYKDTEISTKKITLLVSSENYNLSGGSLSLNTISGNAGKDTAAWKLYTSDGKEITSGITWKLTSATSAQLPTSISIANGLVSWTSQITTGTYEFYVCANYKDTEISTEKITLLVSPSQYVIGFEDNKISYYNPFIKKDEDITLNLEMDEATGNVTYTSTQSINVDVTSSGEIKFKPIFENSSSIYISKNIMYEIIYDNTSQINYNKSIFIYHSNEWLLQDDYPLTFAAFAPIYNKAKIKVTFECDSKVSLIMPIDVWYDRTTPDSKFEIPSGKEEEYKDKIIINYDEGLNTYNCYLNSSNPDNLQNIVPFDICLVCPTGCYSSKNFEITDIQNDVLTEGSCKINVEEQIVPENVEMEDGSIMPTAIILYNIHVEFLPNGNMPTDENYKHNLFTINKKTLDGSILESKCNIIWWFKSLAH